jgi:crotonobetainyl-CoA:carnitine CoA-transferase CaiB-like acyl-CoA transferase
VQISEQKGSGPLAGVKVIDLSVALMGPYCAQILCDLGADVVKVEAPEGDTTRQLGPARSEGHGGMYINMNRGKQSIALDLKHPAGRAALLRLIDGADIFLHSMRSQAIARLGLDYATLAARDPRLIYLNMYGFGRAGPYANRPAYDDVIQAISGLAMMQTELAGGEPSYVASVVADKVGGLTSAYAVMAALYERERSGLGQEIEVPMFEAMTSFMFVEHSVGGIFDPPIGAPVYRRTVSPERRPYRTADGYVGVLIYNDRHWQRFFALLGNPEWSADPRFVTMRARSQNIDYVLGKLNDVFRSDTTASWLERLAQAEIPAAPILSTTDLLDDPHLEAVGYWHHCADADGALKLSGIPTGFSRTPGAIRGAASPLGADGRSVLAAAGFTAEEIAGLLATGALQHIAAP